MGDWLGVALASLVLFLGMAWNDLLAPFQIGFLGSIAAGLAMLLVLERTGRRGDIAACVLLIVSLSSSGLGILFVVAAFVELLWRPDRWRALWIVVLPLVLYGVWYLHYGHSDAMRSNIPEVPTYTAQAAAGATASLLGLAAEWGVPLVVLLVVVGALRLARAPLTPLLAASVAGALTFWGLTALSRAQLNDPDASRYLYPGAVLVVLVVAELARDVRLRPAAWVVVGLLVGGAALSGYGALRDGAAHLQDWSSYLRAELGALQLAGTTVDPNYQPDPLRAPDIRTGQYLDAIRGLGPAGDSPDQVRREGEPQRQTADQVLARTLGFGLGPAPAGASPGSAPAVERSAGGTAAAEGGCLVFRPAGGGALLDMALPEQGVDRRERATRQLQRAVLRGWVLTDAIGHDSGIDTRATQDRAGQEPDGLAPRAAARRPDAGVRGAGDVSEKRSRKVALRDLLGLLISVLSLAAFIWWALNQRRPQFPDTPQDLPTSRSRSGSTA